MCPLIFVKMLNGTSGTVYSGAREKLIHEKNLKSKISGQAPLKHNL
jgi:hypothetical protein